MTVKDLAEFTGKTERAVQNWVKKASVKSSLINEKSSLSSPMKPADYEVDDVELILNESRLGQNAVMIIMENARRPKSKDISTEMSIITFMAQMQKQQESFMSAVLDRLDNNKPISVKQTAKQITYTLPEMDMRDQLRQIVNEYAKKFLDGDYRDAWGVLYEAIYYRLHTNIRLKAKNAKISKLDMIERDGILESAYLIMVEKMGE